MRVFLVILFAFFLFSCSSDDDNSSSQMVSISTNDVIGKWFVSFFEDDSVNETSDFVGYIFDFKANNILVATKGSFELVGEWRIDKSSSGSPDELEIFLPTLDKPLEELNDDWDVVSKSSVRIELREISGGDGHLEQLHFTKM